MKSRGINTLPSVSAVLDLTSTVFIHASEMKEGVELKVMRLDQVDMCLPLWCIHTRLPIAKTAVSVFVMHLAQPCLSLKHSNEPAIDVESSLDWNASVWNS